MASASDVPNRFDVVINSEGYMLADNQESRAEYGFSPTFLARTNITGNYGDNQQDFWMTSKQNDWSLGEQQQFLRVGDDVSLRRFWQGTNIDVRKPGQVTLRQDKRAVTFAAATAWACPYTDKIAVATAQNLYTLDMAGTISDKGAHGLGFTPKAMCHDSVNVFIGAPDAALVRKYDGTFVTFSTGTKNTALEYLNNTIYGLFEGNVAMQLHRFDGAGVVTGIHEWKTGVTAGVRVGIERSTIKAFGGKLLILLSLQDAVELWIYDGQGVSMIAKLPPNFAAGAVEVLHGFVFIAGLFITKATATTDTCVPGIYFYANGQVGLLWKADSSFASTATSDLLPSLTSYDGGLIFNDDTRGTIMYYDIVNGGVHALCSYTVSGTRPLLVANRRFFLHLRTVTGTTQFPDASTVASSGTVISSLMDFDSSQDKLFRTVRVDATIPAGATLDIDRQLDDVAGSWTSVQAGAVSGTEYSLNVTGYSIAIRATLNKGSSTTGPTYKRVRVRAAPLQQRFRKDTFRLNCTGRDGEQHITLRDGTPHAKDGLQMVTDLQTAMALTVPISVTTEHATYNAVIIAEETQFIEISQHEYIAVVTVREV